MDTQFSSSSSLEPPLQNNHNMVIWSNSAFIPDYHVECSSQGNYLVSSLIEKDTTTNENSFFTSHMSKEEFQLREELGKEIEKELEREIMEGILLLVKRLSNLKAKRILRSLKKLNLDEFLNVLHGSSNCGTTSCKASGEEYEYEYEYDSQWHSGQISPTNSAIVSKSSNGKQDEEQVLEDSDEESTMERWSYLSE